jgi:hypothetical protein
MSIDCCPTGFATVPPVHAEGHTMPESVLAPQARGPRTLQRWRSVVNVLPLSVDSPTMKPFTSGAHAYMIEPLSARHCT